MERLLVPLRPEPALNNSVIGRLSPPAAPTKAVPPIVRPRNAGHSGDSWVRQLRATSAAGFITSDAFGSVEDKRWPDGLEQEWFDDGQIVSADRLRLHHKQR